MRTEASRVDTVLAEWTPFLERRLSAKFGPRATAALIELLVFGIKQAWACLFGGLLLAAILATAFLRPEGLGIARYDLLFCIAVGIQVVFLLTRLERVDEAIVIAVFHLAGTAMELFKTSVGSWTYPEEAVLKIGAVPLFSGFMYAAVGSYLARVNRVFDFRFTRYPDRLLTLIVGALIYINFFSHHFLPDIRWLLLAAIALLYLQCDVHYRVWRWRHRMPLLVGFGLVALFIFLAENIATFAGIWFYPEQEQNWRPVSWQKFPAWFLLMIFSWTLVTLVHRPRSADEAGTA